MKYIWVPIILSLATSPAFPASISIVLDGHHFLGPPAFIIEADSYPVGTGILAEAGSPSMFTFRIDDVILNEADALVVRFINDRNIPGQGDRNLYVRSISVDGTTFRGEELETLTPNSSPGGLNSNTSVVRLHKPDEGWPLRSGARQ